MLSILLESNNLNIFLYYELSSTIFRINSATRVFYDLQCYAIYVDNLAPTALAV